MNVSTTNLQRGDPTTVADALWEAAYRRGIRDTLDRLAEIVRDAQAGSPGGDCCGPRVHVDEDAESSG